MSLSRLRILLVTERLTNPLDEGRKNIVWSIYKYLRQKADVLMISDTGNSIKDLEIIKVKLNKFFLNNKLRNIIIQYSPHIIIYVPYASLTFNSFIRAKILKIMRTDSKVGILGVQKRMYSKIQRFFLYFLRPHLLLVLGKSEGTFYKEVGLNVKALPPAVDNQRFKQVWEENKVILRKRHNIENEKIVVTHVGHIKANRNLEYLIDVQKMSGHQVVIVGSTTTTIEKKLKHKLKNHDIIVIDHYMPRIEEIYQLSDMYVFPVKAHDAAIEMPLSVLEAVSCNLPVITTRFGGLENYFKEDEYFRYFEAQDELMKEVSTMQMNHVKNRKKIEGYTWDFLVNEIIEGFSESL
jgi:glycosyltransferase involved in cell wall biosynthesis